jgi:hypothetical protein
VCHGSAGDCSPTRAVLLVHNHNMQFHLFCNALTTPLGTSTFCLSIAEPQGPLRHDA